ncbi:hypothetical protein FHS91_000668 [Sphingobium xanthum]|jgi:hypothetical protein|uniref:YrhB domain-containing protein n=1 Tax=Sphingobium xanthum TaxID=1387165 RepID=UPI001C8C57A0|nr:YrhB domain-containing protein [Sphingobium xanthum]
MTRIEAEALADKTLQDMVGRYDPPCSIMRDKTIELSGGWVCFYQSTEYLRSGNFSDRLVGNGPFYVGHNGSVQELLSALPWEAQIDG